MTILDDNNGLSCTLTLSIKLVPNADDTTWYNVFSEANHVSSTLIHQTIGLGSLGWYKIRNVEPKIKKSNSENKCKPFG